MISRTLIVLIIFLFYASSSIAQQFGGNPPSLKWRQINNDTIRVIFPEGLEKKAHQVAGISIDLANRTFQSIGEKVRKINIVIQNQTTISNGYVGLGPYRSEFQTTPDPNSFSLGSLPWIQSLAIHEYRHVQQYNNFRKGFASGFYFLFGEEGQALANALTVPDWFFEGDAVYQETIVSNQGRGRLPYFFNGYRSLWAAARNYSYMKLRNGSLNDFVPNHYPLGYMLVAYGREKYGEEFWRNVTADASSWKGFFYPMQKAIKKHSGQSFSEFRNNAIKFFNTAKGKIPAANHFLADQEYPQWVDSSSLIYLRTGYNRIPAFVLRTNNEERVVRVRDIPVDNYFSHRNGKLVYASFKADTRWGWRDFSDLKILSLHDGSQSNLTNKSKYFSPDISEDGKHVVAVHIDMEGNSQLHLLNGENGFIEKRLDNPDSLFYTYPKFFSGDRIVTAVRNQEGKMSLAIIDPSGRSKYVLPFSLTTIGFPSVFKESIYFTAAFNGFDRLFRWENDQLYSLPETESEGIITGNYQVNEFNKKLVWTRFTPNGYRLMFTNRTQEEVKFAATNFTLESEKFGITTLSDSLNEFLSERTKQRYPVTVYPKSFHLFNFHSRRPYISDPDYSFSFVSENILNTLVSELSINYNRNEQFKQLGFSAIYGALFPVLKMGTQYTFDRNARIRTNGPRTYWNEWEGTVGLSIPLNFTGGKTFTYLTFGSDFVYNKRYFTGYYKDTFENRAFGYVNAAINFSNRIQQARQHIYPRFAQVVGLNYKNAVTNLEGKQFLATGSLYLPGILLNHNLVLQGAWHGRDTLSNIRFSNSFPFSRGYATNNFHQMWKLGANYHLPLFYPDWGFANIVYFLRIRGNVFYDYTQIADYNNVRRLVNLEFRSYGTEIFFDTRWWNQLPVSFGFRYSRLLDRDTEGRTANQFEFVLPVNLLTRE